MVIYGTLYDKLMAIKVRRRELISSGSIPPVTSTNIGLSYRPQRDVSVCSLFGFLTGPHSAPHTHDFTHDRARQRSYGGPVPKPNSLTSGCTASAYCGNAVVSASESTRPSSTCS